MRSQRITVLVSVILSACASGPATTLRTLPPTMSPDAGRLLAGCTVVESNRDLEIRCGGDIVVAADQQPAAIEPAWVHVAEVMARAHEMSLVWEELTLNTEVGATALHQALIGSEVLLGVSRPQGALRDDMWCTSPLRHRSRCEAILTAMLKPARVADDTPTGTAPIRVAQPTLRGHALSLPTNCGVDMQSDTAAHYTCNGLTMEWRVVTDMDAVAVELDGMYEAHPAGGAPEFLACRLGYEDAVCRGTPLVVTGTTYLDGIGVVAICVSDGATDVMQATSCRVLMNGSW